MENANQSQYPLPGQYKEEDLASLELKIEEVQNHFEKDLIGDGWTLLALKNPSSYLLHSIGKGLKVIENGKEFYSGKLDPTKYKYVRDTLYCKPLNCYFFYTDLHQIFRKDIDDKPPYLYISEIQADGREGAHLEYSRVNQRVIVNSEFWDEEGQKAVLGVLNLETKQVEFKTGPSPGSVDAAFKLLGEKEDRVIAVTKTSVLHFQLDFERRLAETLGSVEIDFLKERGESMLSVSPCQKGKYCFFDILSNKDGTYGSSRVIVYKIDGSSIVQEATLDQIGEPYQRFAIEPIGYFGRFVAWVACSNVDNDSTLVQAFIFDTETKELKELVEKRVQLAVGWVLKVDKFENALYFAEFHGKVFRLSLDL